VTAPELFSGATMERPWPPTCFIRGNSPVGHWVLFAAAASFRPNKERDLLPGRWIKQYTRIWPTSASLSLSVISAGESRFIAIHGSTALKMDLTHLQ